MASILRKLFKRKQQPPLVCAVALDEATGHPIAHDPGHVHTAACFADFEPLAVAELFQSQGCAACAPALPGIHDGAQQPNLLLLSYNVTLFDHLGWRDTHASAANDQRQRAYAKAWGRTSLFTPQVVVNGVADGAAAGGRGEVDEIVGRARAAAKAMDWHLFVDANEAEVRIDTDKQEAAAHDILLVTYAAADETVKPAKGPNKGKKMVHRHVVQSIAKVGEWHGGNLTLPLPGAGGQQMAAGTEAVVLVQAGVGGAIVGAARV